MKLAKAFRKAKQRLWDGEGPSQGKTAYICYALPKRAWEAKDIVMQRIAPNFTLTAWLMDTGVSVDDITEERMQAHRHAWLNQLIKEFE